MPHHTKTSLYAVSCAVLLSACGPAPEGEPDVGIEPSLPEEAPSEEVVSDEGNEVSQATYGGHLGSKLGTTVVTFDSCATNNEWRTTCGAGNSGDMWFHWTAPVTGDYYFTTAASGYNNVLELRLRGDTSKVIACNAGTSESTRGRFRVNGLVAGRQYVIIIDGENGSCGHGHLAIVGR